MKEINAIKLVTTGTNLFQHWMQKNSKLNKTEPCRLDTTVRKILNVGVTRRNLAISSVFHAVHDTGRSPPR